MAKPEGLLRKTKDNSNKRFRERAEWQEGKKIGRPKQVWVWDDAFELTGHWEKVEATA